MSDVELVRILRIVEAELDLDPGEATPETSMQTCANWDSLGHLRLCMALESEYGLTFTTDEINSAISVAKLAELVSRE